MARDTLLGLFEDFSRLDDTFVVHDDGYRIRQQSYRDVATEARQFAAELGKAGIVAGEKVVIWSENRPEWLVALWGTLLAGAVVVPVDYRASGDLLARIANIVGAKLVLVGSEVDPPAGLTSEVRHISGLGKAVPARPSDGSTSELNSEPVISTPEPGSLAEIIFTSGATADPKGVTITHRNILANLIPIEREIAKYRRYEWPFHPLRFLNLLPLSHMFGQSMATFIPPLIGGTVVFSHSYSPTDIVRLVRSRRVSVLVCVPKVLSVLREYVERELPETSGSDPLSGKPWFRRWWHYRRAHRLFGWKFWCIVCGAAPLEAELESYWRKLGFLVVQGYGLTETAPIVTLNHPFRSSHGTVGTPIGGVEVRIADDGEILVRGDNVTSGYYRPTSTGVTADEPFKDGWFHTGDIGELDSAGRLTIKGRKKEMIVTPQGLNVFPEDVEKALLAQAGVREAGVVGLRAGGEERIHAVLVVDPGADVDAAVRGANAALEDHQRVRSTSIWPEATLPRTDGTLKLKRRELQRWAAGEQSGPAVSRSGASVADLVARYASGRAVLPETTLEELGLSSLDRVELMMALEEAFHVTLDESVLAGPKTIGDLEAIVRQDSLPLSDVGTRAETGATPVQQAARGASIVFPSWNRSRPAWWLRRVSLPTWILPFMGLFMDLTVSGIEHLESVEGPVVFASNHQSHLDTPAIFLALPPSRRYRLAPAMAKEFFTAHFNRRAVSFREWLGNSLNYCLACEFFAAFPLPQREAGTRQTMRYMGEMIGDGYSILIFPEGRRSGTDIGHFRPGVGMIGARLGVPVVPVRLSGLDKVMPASSFNPVRGPVRVAFGPPLSLQGSDYAALAKQVEEAVNAL